MQDQPALPAPAIQTIVQFAGGAPWRLELLHAHDHDMLFWITRGQGRAIVEGTRRGIGAHNALFLPAGTLYALDLGAQSFGLALTLPDGPALGFGRMARHLRIRDQQAQADLTAILDAMQRETARTAALQERALAAHAQLVAVWMHRQDVEPPATGNTAARRLVAAYCDLLVRRHRSGVSMAELADALGVTPTHLSRSCKNMCGLTAAEMQTQVSLHAARDLIETGTAPLSRIASHLGFGSAAYFSRFITQHTGKTPSALRHSRPAASKMPG
ncbi:AraC family transcriptional regulator, transcriptional activator of pobA [Lutimaribacter pacificus]|uniref:AraC family transcriptional regulator, transcriptional activator of pobA n=1 Tax=Lutimaribacter pacificus TaxID=391948 RepID=A0A1H0LQF2_9RHOB|nr:helix-turn-helix domain-containing protein [Lutimaribacter pacificus]SDO70100.1 AraC family transcriptional regulator, transcriptional activator of pobA [Lutimaribacter pacificus]SHK04856.1 AraC family transcriptional regulator, transcriptional activator of pobA [Lutimaribacter pacificus]